MQTHTHTHTQSQREFEEICADSKPTSGEVDADVRIEGNRIGVIYPKPTTESRKDLVKTLKKEVGCRMAGSGLRPSRKRWFRSWVGLGLGLSHQEDWGWGRGLG
eukprot:1395477-Amorphochlora_amoeboformis.AAC.1